MAELLNEAVRVGDGPTVVRYPKGTVGPEAEAVGTLGAMDVLAVPADGAAKDVLLLGAGPMAVTVTVRNDPSHGLLAAVCITAPAAAPREAIVKRCAELLGGFQIRHAVEFA